MKIVVIGGTGLIGSKLVAKLTEMGHETIPASPRLGINTLTGEGVAEALDGASTVVDVSNSPNFEYATALPFFETVDPQPAGCRRNGAGRAPRRTVRRRHESPLPARRSHDDDRRLLSGEADPGSADPGLGIPYSIVHATQFFEFIKGIADESTDRGAVRVPPVRFQPMAADDVAAAVGQVAVGAPVNGIVEVGGPEQFRFDELMRRVLAAWGDPREVVTDPDAGYYGIAVGDRTLVPADGARLGEVRIDDWLRQSAGAAMASA